MPIRYNNSSECAALCWTLARGFNRQGGFLLPTPAQATNCPAGTLSSVEGAPILPPVALHRRGRTRRGRLLSLSAPGRYPSLRFSRARGTGSPAGSGRVGGAPLLVPLGWAGTRGCRTRRPLSSQIHDTDERHGGGLHVAPHDARALSTRGRYPPLLLDSLVRGSAPERSDSFVLLNWRCWVFRNTG